MLLSPPSGRAQARFWEFFVSNIRTSMNQLVPFTDRTPAHVAAGGERASYRYFEFLTLFPAWQEGPSGSDYGWYC